jgi:hypothetical protein
MPERKQQAKKWKLPDSLPPTMIKLVLSVEKVMPSLFWNIVDQLSFHRSNCQWRGESTTVPFSTDWIEKFMKKKLISQRKKLLCLKVQTSVVPMAEGNHHLVSNSPYSPDLSPPDRTRSCIEQLFWRPDFLDKDNYAVLKTKMQSFIFTTRAFQTTLRKFE